MKNKSVDFTWVKEVENLIKSPEFCNSITTTLELLEQINELIPSSQMRLLKLNLSLVVDSLKVCQKQIFRLVQLYRRKWFV